MRCAFARVSSRKKACGSACTILNILYDDLFVRAARPRNLGAVSASGRRKYVKCFVIFWWRCGRNVFHARITNKTIEMPKEHRRLTDWRRSRAPNFTENNETRSVELVHALEIVSGVPVKWWKHICRLCWAHTVHVYVPYSCARGYAKPERLSKTVVHKKQKYLETFFQSPVTAHTCVFIQSSLHSMKFLKLNLIFEIPIHRQKFTWARKWRSKFQ